MSRPYRDTFTATEMPDGSVTVKLHGFPAETTGATAEEAMRKAGAMMDISRKQAADFRVMLADMTEEDE